MQRKIRKVAIMQSKLSILVLASALAGCSTYVNHDEPQRGVSSINEPVVERRDFSFDVATGDGYLSPAEAARLDGWLQGLGAGYGDTVYVGGPNAALVRPQIAGVAGRYGLLLAAGAPAVGGPLAPGMTRVVISRVTAGVPHCPNWDEKAVANANNHMLSNFGCAANSNLVAMVANPEDLVHGREGSGLSDAATASKAINLYRGWPLTGTAEGQARRPLQDVNTKKGDK